MKAKVRNVALFINKHKKNAPALGKKICAFLEKRKIAVNTSLEFENSQYLEKADLVISLGGDGTILALARQMKKRSVPVLGVNFGRLGFLTEVRPANVMKELSAYLSGELQIEERMMLECHLKSQKHKVDRRLLALNDMVISREGVSRLVAIDILVSGEALAAFRGDGVILATPTGSTAYSLSAGGAVVHPHVNSMMVTPICPHASSMHPTVIPANEKVMIAIRRERRDARAVLTADGQEIVEVDDSFGIEVTRFRLPFKLIKSSRHNYYETINRHLHFSSLNHGKTFNYR